MKEAIAEWYSTAKLRSREIVYVSIWYQKYRMENIVWKYYI